MDQNGDYVEVPKSDPAINSFNDFFQWIGAFTGWSDPPTSYYPLLLNYDKDGYDGLTYIDYSSEAKYKVTDRNEYQGFWPSDSSYRDYFCAIDNFFALNDDGVRVERTDKTYFMFTYFYTNSTLNADTIAGVGDTLADSGSIFEVNGLKSTNFDKRMEEEAGSATYPWLKYVQIAIVVASILIGGGGQLLFNAGKAAVKKLTQKIGQMTLKQLFKFQGSVAISTLALFGLSNILLSQVLASQSAETVYYGVTNESLGYLGRSYRREIIYDEEGKLLIQVDASAENDQEVQYVYYSNTRPNDYYSHRYYVYVDNGTDGYDTIFLDSIENATLQTSGNFEGAYYFQYGKKNAYAYEYYIYQNGEYYVLLDALETAIVPTQMPIPENLKSPADYIFTRGSYYVRGKYDGSLYIYDQNTGERGIDNAIVYNENTGEYTINNVSWDESRYGAISTETTLRYIIDKNIDEDNEVDGVINLGDWMTSEDLYYYGYGYMKNAYYTASGNDVGGDKKVGVFSCVGTTAPAGTAGINYITRTYWEEIREEDGSITREPTVYYYTIQSISDNSTLFDSAERASGTIAERPNTGDRINVRLYPYSFENPYSSYIANSQDEYYYFVNTDSDKDGIQHEVTYYYYEGGYITANYNDELLAYKKIGEVTSLSDVENVVLYDSSGDSKLYSYKEIYNELNKGQVLYTIDISAYTTTDTDTTTDTELYKIDNQFKESGGYLYQIISDKQISDGKLSTIVFTMPNSNSKDYNENKYLMNEDLQFYTRYKYSGLEYEGRDLFGTGAWIYNEEAFYIYRKDQTIPNAGMKTFLVESSRIILSGIYYDGTSSRSVGGVNMV